MDQNKAQANVPGKMAQSQELTEAINELHNFSFEDDDLKQDGQRISSAKLKKMVKKLSNFSFEFEKVEEEEDKNLEAGCLSCS